MNYAPIRPATVADAAAIAALHAVSWRSAYRGIFKESTLGPTLDGERRAHWGGKLAALVPDDTVLIAGDLGFIVVWAKGDPGFGASIDNLHIRPERRSGGLGRRLLARRCGGSPDVARPALISVYSTTTGAPSISVADSAARSSKGVSTRSMEPRSRTVAS